MMLVRADLTWHGNTFANPKNICKTLCLFMMESVFFCQSCLELFSMYHESIFMNHENENSRFAA